MKFGETLSFRSFSLIGVRHKAQGAKAGFYFPGFLAGGETGPIGGPNVAGGDAFGWGGTTFSQPLGQSLT